MSQQKDGKEASYEWWQLSLIGVGCIIGTGFFLGSGIAIKLTGPSVVLSFLLAATGTYIVYEALAKMSAKDPQKGSFRTYAKKAFGRWAGFSSGWAYWCSEMLIIGSQLTAISLLSKFWFPDVPLWIFASGFAIFGLLVLFIGTKGFGKLESIFAVTKVAAIFMFIVVAVVAVAGIIEGDQKSGFPGSFTEVFPNGGLGFWSSLLFAFYAFGGIEVMSIMAVHLKNKEDAPKAGKVMIALLVTIYITAISLVLYLLPWDGVKDDKSPFVTALDSYNLDFFPHVFIGAIIIAGFSTMSASLFSVTTILLTLSEDGDAPAFFGKQLKWKLPVPLPALALTAVVLMMSIIASRLLPSNVYEYVTTAAGMMILYNWLFILTMSHRIFEPTKGDKVKRYIAYILLVVALSGTLADSTSRPGFFISLGFLTIIAIVVFFLQKRWKKEEGQSSKTSGQSPLTQSKGQTQS